MVLVRFYKLLKWSIYNIVLIFAASEALLRMIPSLMPFGHTWNYIHHYLEISRFLEQPSQLAWNGYRTIAMGDSFTRGGCSHANLH